MPTWIIYALLSMFFAGLTAVLAKAGLKNISADLGLGIRTVVIFILVAILNFSTNTLSEWGKLPGRELMFLVVSGVTTTLSWVFYYRAVKLGLVTYVAVIDKGSIVVVLLLAFLFLGEALTPKILLGAGLVLAGMLVLVWK